MIFVFQSCPSGRIKGFASFKEILGDTVIEPVDYFAELRTSFTLNIKPYGNYNNNLFELIFIQ